MTIEEKEIPLFDSKKPASSVPSNFTLPSVARKVMETFFLGWTIGFDFSWKTALLLTDSSRHHLRLSEPTKHIKRTGSLFCLHVCDLLLHKSASLESGIHGTSRLHKLRPDFAREMTRTHGLLSRQCTVLAPTTPLHFTAPESTTSIEFWMRNVICMLSLYCFHVATATILSCSP